MFAGPRRYLPPNSFKFSIGLSTVARSTFALRASVDNLRQRFGAEVGADVQDRTGDLVLTKDALCQLSYIGLRACAITRRDGRQVGLRSAVH
jgi:hypothetical protein